MGTALVLAIFLPLVASFILGWTVQWVGHSRIGWLAAPFPLVSLGAVVWMARSRDGDPAVVFSRPWIPRLDIELSFLVDGLSIFFALVVSGIGILIFFYAIGYFGGKGKHQGKFYSFMLLFMAAMLGTVFSDNLILLFTFWELTGLASFLLIGFNHEEEKSRAGARAALLVTLLTGLFTLAGIIMLGRTAGTFSLTAIMESGLAGTEKDVWLNASLVLIMLGAFGKSAQFPFHFWLPNAMAAPTPVSAYLHSATMVKLGIFLSARVFTALHGAELWVPLLGWVGFFTMVWSAWLALRSNDLKAILAYSTISALGYLIGMYGLGGAIGVKYDFMHIAAHALFKASLFMMVGIVDHATGIRDIRQLGGLRKRLPLMAGVTVLGCASMAGVFPTLGFLSKEYMLADALEGIGSLGLTGWTWACFAITASVFKIAFALRLVLHIFWGEEPEEVRRHYHDPGWFVQFPPVLLAAGTLVLGAAPFLMNRFLAFLAVPGLHAAEPALALWHGVTTELLLSAGILVLGFSVFQLAERMRWSFAFVPRPLRFDDHFETLLRSFNTFTKRLTAFLRADNPMDYLPVIILFLLCVMSLFKGLIFLGEDWNAGDFFLADPNVSVLRIFTGGLIILCVLGAIVLFRWTSQLISLSAAGFLITFYFVLYKAPDLAMTQILVESATILLILLLLSRFPRRAQEGERRDATVTARRNLALVLSIGTGGLVTMLMFIAGSNRHADPIGQRFLDTTVEFAKGTNTVNTILVDYRGLDTLGEIAVLLIAVLGGIGLLLRYKRDSDQAARGALGAPGFGLPHLRPKTEEKGGGAS